MTDREQYTPGPASGAQVRKDGEKWTLILVRELRHSPEKVWQALTDPAHLREWAPFEADGSLGMAGTTVRLTTVAAPTPQVSETKVTRADAPRVPVSAPFPTQGGQAAVRSTLTPTPPRSGSAPVRGPPSRSKGPRELRRGAPGEPIPVRSAHRLRGHR